MPIFDKKNIIKIEKDDLDDAKLSCADFADEYTRKRAFMNVLGARLAIKMLFSKKIEANNVYSLYTIHNVLEELDIADIYYNDIKIDTRLVFNKDEIFIPKSHFESNILPDLYLVLELNKDFSSANPLGFFEPKDLDKENENKDFYFYEYDKLNSIKDIKTFLKSFEAESSSQASKDDLNKAEELFLSLADKEISPDDKLFLFKQLTNSIDLREKFVEFENFEIISKEIASNEDILGDGVLDIIGAQQVFEDELEELSLKDEKAEVIGEVLSDLILDENKIEIEGAEEEVSSNTESDDLFLRELLGEEIETDEIPAEKEQEPEEHEEQEQEEKVLFGLEEEEKGEGEGEEIESDEESPEFDFSSLSETIGVFDDAETLGIPFNVGLDESAVKAGADSETNLEEEALTELNVEDLEEITPLKEESKPELTFSPLVDKQIGGVEEAPKQGFTEAELQIEESALIEEEQQQQEEELPYVHESSSEEETDAFLSEVDSLLNDMDLSEEKRNLFEDNLNLMDEDQQELLSEEGTYKYDPMLEPPVGDEYNLSGEDFDFKDEGDPLQVLFKKDQNPEMENKGENIVSSSINKDKKMVLAATVASVVLITLVIGGSTIYNNMQNGHTANNMPPSPPVTTQVSNQETGQNAPMPGDASQQMNGTGMDSTGQQANNSSISSDSQNSRDMGQSLSDAFLSEPVNASISKVAWEIPEDLSYNDAFRSYLQVAGKNIKLNLQNDLLLATEMAYSNKVVVDLTINKDGSLQTEVIATSSGSKQIDKIVLQSVKETLKYLKMPSNEVKGNSVDATLIINF